MAQASVWDSEPMLAEAAEPFSRPGWLFEIKYDGFRVFAGRESGRPRLRYRSGIDATGAFPEIAGALSRLPHRDVVLDGEVVVLDASGRPSFQRLQQRFQARGAEAERLSASHPATLMAFDLLQVGADDLRARPLVHRKERLAAILPRSGALAYVDHVISAGLELFEEVRRLDLEGVVGKRADSPYVPGRSADWRKSRVVHAADFVVVGWTVVRVGRDGGLHLAAWKGDVLTYAGRVGSGFEAGVLDTVRRTLDPFRRATPPCVGAVPRGRGHVWVEPRVVCEVRYREWTEAGLLRQPVFLRFQSDRSAT